MAHRQYTSQYKTRIVLEVLQGEKELGEIAAENTGLNGLPRASGKAIRAADAGAGLPSGLLSHLGKANPGI